MLCHAMPCHAMLCYAGGDLGWRGGLGPNDSLAVWDQTCNHDVANDVDDPRLVSEPYASRVRAALRGDSEAPSVTLSDASGAARGELAGEPVRDAPGEQE